MQHKLAGMPAEITAMHLYCFRMAELQEQGRWTGPMASLATSHHARKARPVCLDARKISAATDCWWITTSPDT